MFEKIKSHLGEVINISETCPEMYRVKCFEILLAALVEEEAALTPSTAGKPAAREGLTKSADDFFSRHNVSDQEWTKIFHLHDNSYSIIVKDLKERATAKKQVKLALLLGIKSLLETGQANVSRESLISTCEQYSAYDRGNFATTMKNRKNLFLAKGDGWTLTVPGQSEAANTVKELAQ